ncbi:TnsA endonuclease N-terminal domain-containing protein [Alteromonas sp. a30]|uniref:TnsA endonuclease N-terminal domain-containing protein n=1 Tax=Alteromonas sp. a30 TaxID=2730917 RepID=UPI00227F6AD2|nr:TnsA endonuclease N-terminal domain-containing protein [Alteromonas sp. a30]MCY7296243.1 heteromeric transposase endonuclease subunit TnsA [Alteromonas sp. a30]
MPRFRDLKTFKDFQRALKNKYGIGEGESYKPWLRVQDVPSRGSSAKIQGIKIDREHHTLSEGESAYFYLAEYRDSVIDIREQFPLLPIDLSIKIASYLGVVHPTIPDSKALNVMTTDFVLTCFDKKKGTWYEAVSVKSKEEDLANKRTAEKLEIERIWWQLLDIPFRVYVNTPESQSKSKNIQWFTAPLRHGEVFPDSLIFAACDLLHVGPMITDQVCSEFSLKFDIDGAQALSLLKTLFAKKIVDVNLDNPMPESGVFEVINISQARAKQHAG